MARFVTIQRGEELAAIALSLTLAPWHHARVADIRIGDPFRPRAEEWPRLHDTLTNTPADAIIISQFLEGDMLMSAYLLAPIRAKRGGDQIKIAQILDPATPFQPLALTQQQELVSIPNIDRAGCKRLCAEVNGRIQAIPANAADYILFVDDALVIQRCIANCITPADLGGRQRRVVDFGNAHAILSQQNLPTAVVTDTVELLVGASPFTGLGLCTILNSTPRFQTIPRVLYSSNLFSNAGPGQFPTLKAFDQVFVQNANLESMLDAFLREA